MALESNHPISKSFKFAFDGLKIAVLKGRNFRIQLIFALLAVIGGLILNFSRGEWLDLVLIISLVLVLELVNTTIEALVDLVSPQIQEKAKIAKDVAAATVLLASIGSVVIGILLFLPKILSFI